MKRFVASVLAIICVLSGIAGATTPALASEPESETVLVSAGEEVITADSVPAPYEEENSDDFETEVIEEAEEPGPVDYQEEEDNAPADFDIPEDESSLSDAIVPEDDSYVSDQIEIPADTESVAADEEVQEEIVGTADSTGTDAEIETGDYYIISGSIQSPIFIPKELLL